MIKTRAFVWVFFVFKLILGSDRDYPQDLIGKRAKRSAKSF
jgi:hypothetical protein